jgi:uncharacterized MAPEG superfamily protein
MSTDLVMLAWSAAFCVALFLPYVMARTLVWGLADTVGYPKNPPALPDWAERARRAHMNMVENLAPFAALVLVAQASGRASTATAMGATIFFWSRIVHAIVFIAGIPWLRTLAFLGGVIGMAMIFFAIIG